MEEINGFQLKENKSQGFIKLYRSFKNWEWYDDIKTTRVFIHCLLSANYAPKKWRGKIIERGSFVTSLSGFAKETGLSVKEIRTSLQRLRATGEIETKSNNKFSVIVILKFDKYQENDKLKESPQPEDEQNEGNQEATNGQASDKQEAINGQSEGNQRATNKNIKNIKKEKNIKKNFVAKSFFEKLFAGDSEYQKNNSHLKGLFLEFLEYKTQIKKQFKTESGVEKAFKDFIRLSENDAELGRLLVDNTIARGWQGIYDLSAEQKKAFKAKKQNQTEKVDWESRCM